MKDFRCDGSYKNDLKDYSENILEEYGVSAKSSEREIICMSDEGNVVATKLYADLVYYKKILRKHPYRDAFNLYLKSAGITIEDGEWQFSDRAYPLAFWNIGYILVNYKRESYLKYVEKIDVIENMTLSERLSMALELAVSTLEYESVAGAINLVGRILKEVSEDEKLFAEVQPVIQKKIANLVIPEIKEKIEDCETQEQCAKASDTFFVAAAQSGYVFACNSLAAREADKIVDLYNQMSDFAKAVKKGDEEKLESMHVDNDLKNQIDKCIIDYICYLKIAADRYESYAANRLGLFYITGEIKGSNGTAALKGYIDPSLAKEYFEKATVYPDENSAWGYLNLMKYFPKTYEKDIDLMNEHMDYIKALNPAVYSIAMDL